MNDVSGYNTCHNLALRRGTRQLTRLYDSHLAPAGLTISQFSILSVIDNHPEIRVSELGDIMVMERTTLLRNLKPMQAEDWVMSAKADGERAHVFSLTAEGKALLDQAVPLWLEAQAAFEAKMGPDRASRLRDDNLAVGAIDAL